MIVDASLYISYLPKYFQNDYRYTPQLTMEWKKYLKKLRNKYGNEQFSTRYEDNDFTMVRSKKRKIYS